MTAGEAPDVADDDDDGPPRPDEDATIADTFNEGADGARLSNCAAEFLLGVEQTIDLEVFEPLPTVPRPDNEAVDADVLLRLPMPPIV